MNKKIAFLYFDDELGFCLVDKDTKQWVTSVDVGDNCSDVDWAYVNQQAEKFGYVADAPS